MSILRKSIPHACVTIRKHSTTRNGKRPFSGRPDRAARCSESTTLEKNQESLLACRYLV